MDNTATDTNVAVPLADIAVLKLVDNPAPTVGDQVTFTVTATNLGPDVATGVAVTDWLPLGLTFVSASATARDARPGRAVSGKSARCRCSAARR